MFFMVFPDFRCPSIDPPKGITLVSLLFSPPFLLVSSILNQYLSFKAYLGEETNVGKVYARLATKHMSTAQKNI